MDRSALEQVLNPPTIWGFDLPNVFKFYNHFKVQMPLFFLLSGFCLTLGYGKKSYNSENSDDSVINTKEFLFGRVTRILPVYYFTLLFAIPLLPLGHSYFSPSNYSCVFGGTFAAFFLIQMWILILWFGPNGPSWTVSTLSFFYLLFPK